MAAKQHGMRSGSRGNESLQVERTLGFATFWLGYFGARPVQGTYLVSNPGAITLRASWGPCMHQVKQMHLKAFCKGLNTIRNNPLPSSPPPPSKVDLLH